MSMMSTKIGRNEPCYCGSGKKYKKCCLHQTPSESQTALMASQKRMSRKIEHRFGEQQEIWLGQTELKMSEVILALVKEWWDECETADEHRNALTLVCAAWNMSFLPIEERERHMQAELCKTLKKSAISAEEQHALQTMINYIIQKKLQYYPDINRMIVDYELIDTRDGDYHLNIASTLSQEEWERVGEA